MAIVKILSESFNVLFNCFWFYSRSSLVNATILINKGKGGFVIFLLGWNPTIFLT